MTPDDMDQWNERLKDPAFLIKNFREFPSIEKYREEYNDEGELLSRCPCCWELKGTWVVEYWNGRWGRGPKEPKWVQADMCYWCFCTLAEIEPKTPRKDYFALERSMLESPLKEAA